MQGAGGSGGAAGGCLQQLQHLAHALVRRGDAWNQLRYQLPPVQSGGNGDESGSVSCDELKQQHPFQQSVPP